MTEQLGRVGNRPIQVPPDAASIATLINSSIKPGSGVYLAFNEGMMNVFFDRLGDWTISVALSTRSSLLSAFGRLLEDQGYFRATETDGKVYYIWTSALHGIVDKRRHAEETLLGTLKVLESGASPQYIS